MQFLIFCCLFVFVTTQIQEYPTAQETATDKEKKVGRLIDTMDIAQSISKEVQRINDSLEIYRVVEKDLFGESAEGGILTAYYNRLNNLKKITTIFYGEIGKSVTEYYLNNEKIFFVDIQEYNYNKPMYLEGSQIKSIRNSKYYFNDSRMIVWKNYSNHIVSHHSKEFIQEEELLLKDIDNILAELGDHHIPVTSRLESGDTVRCKYVAQCLSTGYVIQGSRTTSGDVIHVTPVNKNVPMEK